MAGLLQSVFQPHGKVKSPSIKINAAPSEATAAQGVADVIKSRQGRGLGSTNLSGMRQMMSSYQSGKSTLGAG